MKVATGTDAGLVPDHGDNLQEMALLVESGGMTHLEAITAGTNSSAELCGLGDTLGTLEAGEIADVVVRKGNPDSDTKLLGDHDNILVVLKEGVPKSNRAGYAIRAVPAGRSQSRGSDASPAPTAVTEGPSTAGSMERSPFSIASSTVMARSATWTSSPWPAPFTPSSNMM